MSQHLMCPTFVLHHRATHFEHATCAFHVEPLQERSDKMADEQKLFLSLHDWLQLLFHKPARRHQVIIALQL